MRKVTILGLCLLASLTACGSEAPTGVSAPGSPSYDGGWTMGSGNRSEDDSGGTTTASDSTTVAAFGGWTMGSGN